MSLKWLEVDADQAARDLLGCKVIREINGQTLSARIVETEAYSQDDPASHTFRGKTARNGSMFGTAGHAYVYFTYGMHYCFNIVCGLPDFGAGVLIRALEPIEGIEAMEAIRNQNDVRKLMNGPGKLCQALGINRELDGHDLSEPPLRLVKEGPIKPELIVNTTRIGISREKDALRRFYIKGNPFVSR